MIESVQERQKGAFDFGRYYDNLCALQDSCPVPAVKAHLHDGVLDINGDRIRAADWEPIFNSITINKNLKFIGVRSYFQLQVDEKTSERRAAILKSRIPVIRGKEMSLRLCRALKSCLDTTENLQCIELQGLPIREKDLSLLVKGIVKNESLKHLSLEFCRIGDFGVQIICQALKQAGNVNTLNLTGCSLSYNGMESIAELIKYQAMSRHNEAWKESLRYRRPNLDCMSGVRRITLNNNPLIDNRGAIILADAMKDDLWVKAIDLQQCGIGNGGAKAFLKVLQHNSTLVVLDLRQNPLIDRDLLRSVTEQVLVNSNGKDSDYRWLRVELVKQQEVAPSSRSVSRFGDASRRPAFRPGGTVHMRAMTAPMTPRSRRLHDEEESGARGLPWRTAARATRYKGYPPDHVPGKTHLEERSEASIDAPTSARTEEEVETVDDESSVVSPLVMEFEQSPPPGSTVKDLRIQVMHLRRKMTEEAKARRKAEEKMVELMMENQRLKRDMDHRETIEERGLHSRSLFGSSGGGGSLHDEKILRNIEQSFQQFHAFLDLLRDAGLGRVVTAAGMDQLPRVGPTTTSFVSPPPRQELYRDEAPVIDPVEQSYRSAVHARSEADKLYQRLKEATSRGSDATRVLSPAASFPDKEESVEEVEEERTWTRDVAPSPPQKETEVEVEVEDRYETIPSPRDDEEGVTAAVDALIPEEKQDTEIEEKVDNFVLTPRMERSGHVSSDEEEEVGNASKSAADDNYNSDTFEASEGSRFGRSFGTEDLGKMKASLDNVQEIDMEDF